MEKSVKAGLKSVKGLSSPEPARKDVLSNETERQEVTQGTGKKLRGQEYIYHSVRPMPERTQKE